MLPSGAVVTRLVGVPADGVVQLDALMRWRTRVGGGGGQPGDLCRGGVVRAQSGQVALGVTQAGLKRDGTLKCRFGQF